MAKVIYNRAVMYANKIVIQNQLFQHCTKLDPPFTSASNFYMEPFKKGWTKRNSCGNMYGVSHRHLYEKERAEMFARE